MIGLRLLVTCMKGTNTQIMLGDCAASRDVKQRTNELVNLAFSARHREIGVWAFTQQMTSIAKAFRENIVTLVLSYTPPTKDMKIIFEDYAGELSNDKKKELTAKLQREKYTSYSNFAMPSVKILKILKCVKKKKS